MKAVVLAVIGVAACLGLVPRAGQAATLIVYPPWGISNAIRTSSPGDTILVSPGTYDPEPGWPIEHPLTIIGIGGAAMNEIGVTCSFAMFQVEHGVTNVLIDGLTMTTSSSEPYPALAVAIVVGDGQAIIRDCVFRDLEMGVEVRWGTVDVEGCLFYSDERNGIHGLYMHGASGQVIGNTFTSSTFAISLFEHSDPIIARNIVVGNEETGIGCYTGSVTNLECNDVWGNPLGNYVGCEDPTGTNGNISADPLFCDLAGLDFHLQPDSPCLPDHSPPACGLIGALGPCESSGMPDAEWGALRLAVSPNPVRRQAVITYPDRLRMPMLEIYDTQGRVVDVLRPTAPPYIWSPSQAIPPGVYFVRLRAAAGSTTTKFVLLAR